MLWVHPLAKDQLARRDPLPDEGVVQGSQVLEKLIDDKYSGLIAEADGDDAPASFSLQGREGRTWQGHRYLRMFRPLRKARTGLDPKTAYEPTPVPRSHFPAHATLVSHLVRVLATKSRGERNLAAIPNGFRHIPQGRRHRRLEVVRKLPNLWHLRPCSEELLVSGVDPHRIPRRGPSL